MQFRSRVDVYLVVYDWDTVRLFKMMFPPKINHRINIYQPKPLIPVWELGVYYLSRLLRSQKGTLITSLIFILYSVSLRSCICRCVL